MLLFFGGCNNKTKNNDFFYRDYDFKKDAGINKISISEKNELMNKNISFVEIIYNKSEVDSIYLTDLSQKYTRTIAIKKYKVNDRTVYHLIWPSELYGFGYEYLFYSFSGITDYSFVAPVVNPDSTVECIITNTTINFSESQMCLIKQKDTVDFIKTLLAGKPIQISRVIQKKGLKTPLNESWTLFSYFGYKSKQ